MIRIIRISTVVIAAALAASCAGFKAPPNLTPVGKISFYNYKLGQANEQLVKFAIDAEREKVITVNEARVIRDGAKKVSLAAIDLETALSAGGDQKETLKKSLEIIKVALRKIPENVSPATAKVAQGYISTILVFVTAVESFL